ncbi:hypothetical protein [Flavobacterium sp. UGB4466]|uniref:hypothetical protein n=1 Tax=Flavobacterium sp. UGB4466 TaxID=2730889 RepID=UPI00192AFBEC|nr:hypothetical protein [Flavobacterium sp. UGB4466]
MKNLYKFILLSIFTLYLSCSSKIEEKQIIGKYEIDKFVTRDTLVKAEEYQLLLINADKTFELKNDNTKTNSVGTWKSNKSENDNEIIIEFSFSDRKVKGLLNGTIISFSYPDDLYKGRYSNLLYVKLRK